MSPLLPYGAPGRYAKYNLGCPRCSLAKQASRVYQTITGRRISVSKLSRSEKELLARVRQKYNSRLEWTRFAAWWNAEFTKTGLTTTSPVYSICQDLEARLGIH